MTTGHLIFYCGIGLLIFTVILAVVFWIKRPHYDPDRAAGKRVPPPNAPLLLETPALQETELISSPPECSASTDSSETELL